MEITWDLSEQNILEGKAGDCGRRNPVALSLLDAFDKLGQMPLFVIAGTTSLYVYVENGGWWHAECPAIAKTVINTVNCEIPVSPVTFTAEFTFLPD